MEKEAKVEELLAKNWGEIVDLLLQLREKWKKHTDFVHLMNIDYVDADLQRHIGMAFHRGDFYLALPDLLEFSRSQGGIEYFMVGKEKPKSGQRPR